MKVFCRTDYSLYFCTTARLSGIAAETNILQDTNMKNQKIFRRLYICSALIASSTMAMAQSGTNSPYSQYGLGILSDQSQGRSRGMGGVGIGLRSKTNVNSINPASYSSVDSLTMIVDAGISGQVTNFKEGGKRINANNADFEYLAASFRLMPKMGLGVGILPYTNIGYNYTSSTKVGGESSTTSTSTYDGEGGIHQAYVGLGYGISKGLSVGANFSYLWGTYERTVTIANSDAYVRTMTRTYGATVTSYKIDLGAQWQGKVGKDNLLTIGAIYGLGHNIGGNPEMTTTYTDPQTSVSSTSTEYATNGLSIPHSLGVGLAWEQAKRLTLAADYTLQKWGTLDYPIADNNSATYSIGNGLLKDRHKVSLGVEWTPNSMSRNLLNRINYRFGGSVSTPYIKVNGQDGPKEYSVSGGFGIPITNSWNNRSILNISGQWSHAAADGLITENTFRINIGLTFNERWFMKWKVQ